MIYGKYLQKKKWKKGKGIGKRGERNGTGNLVEWL